MNKKQAIAGVALIVTAIILGAFGAHALKTYVDAEGLISYETGVRYQIYHGIALLILGLNSDKLQMMSKWVVPLLLTGVLMFSVSIYLLVLQPVFGIHLGFLGPVTPLGGTLMIAGWGVLLKNLLLSK